MKKGQFLRFLSKNCSNRMLRCSFQAFDITRNDSEPSSGYFRDFGQNNRFWPTVPCSQSKLAVRNNNFGRMAIAFMAIAFMIVLAINTRVYEYCRRGHRVVWAGSDEYTESDE